MRDRPAISETQGVELKVTKGFDTSALLRAVPFPSHEYMRASFQVLHHQRHQLQRKRGQHVKSLVFLTALARYQCCDIVNGFPRPRGGSCFTTAGIGRDEISRNEFGIMP